MSLNIEHQNSQCYAVRVEQAATHIGRGEWACGHAITSGLIQCALAGGCPKRGECSHAAERMMGVIKGLLGN
jgi:hypothetical protein